VDIDNFDVMAMVAIGRRGPKDNLLHKSRKGNSQTIETSDRNCNGRTV
jgi:hypothetical protein